MFWAFRLVQDVAFENVAQSDINVLKKEKLSRIDGDDVKVETVARKIFSKHREWQANDKSRLCSGAS